VDPFQTFLQGVFYMKNNLIEFLGTFFFTLAIALASPNALAIGLVLLAVTYIGRHISGAYYNPALVIAGWRRGSLDGEHVIAYLIAQVLGALAALLLVLYVFDVPFLHPLPPEIHPVVVLGFEVLITFAFALVFLSLSHGSHAKEHSHVAGIVIGLAFAGLATFGALFNPAVAAGSVIVDAISGAALDKTGLWYLGVFVLGPVLGGFAAAHVHEYLNSK
jgi:glycerol uptake facilitator-like aquaporin